MTTSRRCQCDINTTACACMETSANENFITNYLQLFKRATNRFALAKVRRVTFYHNQVIYDRELGLYFENAGTKKTTNQRLADKLLLLLLFPFLLRCSPGSSAERIYSCTSWHRFATVFGWHCFLTIACTIRNY